MFGDLDDEPEDCLHLQVHPYEEMQGLMRDDSSADRDGDFVSDYDPVLEWSYLYYRFLDHC